MNIELSNGYVVLKDFITHRASRDYQATLLKGTRMKPTGDVDEKGRPKMEYDIDPSNSDRANEAFVIAMIEKIVRKDGDQETEIPATIEWLESMPQREFQKLEQAVLDIKHREDEEAKKS